jgi:hypothetical protein
MENQELKTCSNCRRTMLINFFMINRKGDRYKTCDRCRIMIYPESTSPNRLTNGEYENQRKEYLRNYMKQNFTCQCGATLHIGNKSKHLKSKKHIQGLKDQNN